MTTTPPVQYPTYPLLPISPHSAPPPRFLSEADCQNLTQRLTRFAQGGGQTCAIIGSAWRGNVRWARNLVSTAGDVQTNHITVGRRIQGANSPWVEINETSDAALIAAVRRSERLARFFAEYRGADLFTHILQEPATNPALFSQATLQMEAEPRAAAARELAQSAAAAGMLSAGYIQVSAQSIAYMTSWGVSRYFQYTWAQYSVTVRDPAGTGSGWAGVDWPDWSKIDGAHLSAVALEKCLASRNPVRVEPGRYTTILEPQAVCDLLAPFMSNVLGRDDYTYGHNETVEGGVFNKEPAGPNQPGFSKLGMRVMDERITISADPMDPEVGFPPFRSSGLFSSMDLPVYHAATWIDRGVLANLAYDRDYGMQKLGKNTGLPNSGAFRISVHGETTSIAEMIATTTRGLLVTRFDQETVLDPQSYLMRGYTRDGLWLIEHGKISKPAINLAFTESPLFALNNVEQLGVPQRVFHPPSTRGWFETPQPAFVPALKVKDFSFTALIDAV